MRSQSKWIEERLEEKKEREEKERAQSEDPPPPQRRLRSVDSLSPEERAARAARRSSPRARGWGSGEPGAAGPIRGAGGTGTTADPHQE